MKEHIETAVPRIKFVSGESDKARKKANGHSCGTLAARLDDHTQHGQQIIKS